MAVMGGFVPQNQSTTTTVLQAVFGDSAGSNNSGGNMTAAAAAAASAATLNYRRYGVGEKVLVCDPHQQGSSETPSPSILVNRFGYPPGSSAGAPDEHRGGPYVYVLATVKRVHFEEDSPFYSVTRADTRQDQRADAEWMEPVLTARGEVSALKAANHKPIHGPSHVGSNNRHIMRTRRKSFMDRLQSTGVAPPIFKINQIPVRTEITLKRATTCLLTTKRFPVPGGDASV
jgi:hypothetical protein